MGENKDSTNIRNRMDSLSSFLNKIQTTMLPHLTLGSAPHRKISLNYDWSALFGTSDSHMKSTDTDISNINQSPEQTVVLKGSSMTEKNVKAHVKQKNNQQLHIYKEGEYFKGKVERETIKNDSLLKLTQNLSNKRKLSQESREISNRKDDLNINETDHAEQKTKTMKVVQQQPLQSVTTQKRNYVESIMDTLKKKQPGTETLQKKQLTQEKPELMSYSLKSLIADINAKTNISKVTQDNNFNREVTRDISKEKSIALNQTSVSSSVHPITSETKLGKQKRITQGQFVADINEKTRHINNSQDIFSQSEMNEDSNDSHNVNDSYVGMSPLTPDVVPSPCSVADVCSNMPTPQARVVSKLDNSDTYGIQSQPHEEPQYTPAKDSNSRNKKGISNEQSGMNIRSKYFLTSSEEQSDDNQLFPRRANQDVSEYSNVYSPQYYDYLNLGPVFSPPQASVENEELSEYNFMQTSSTGIANSGEQKGAPVTKDKTSSNFSFNFTSVPSKSTIFNLF